MTDRYLEARVARVTGGATGMGRAIALTLTEAGAEVAIGSLMESGRAKVVKEQSVYLLSPEEMEQTPQEIEARGVRATALPLDVGSLGSVQGFFGAVLECHGKVDTLVNAAGATARHRVIDHSDELWDRIINVDLTGPYRTTKALPARHGGAEMGPHHQHRPDGRQCRRHRPQRLLRRQDRPARTDPLRGPGGRAGRGVLQRDQSRLCSHAPEQHRHDAADAGGRRGDEPRCLSPLGRADDPAEAMDRRDRDWRTCRLPLP